MIADGQDLYLDLCVNHRWIDQVHIIATESGAYMAIKALRIIDLFGTGLQDDPQRLGAAWTSEQVLDEDSNTPVGNNPISNLIR